MNFKTCYHLAIKFIYAKFHKEFKCVTLPYHALPLFLYKNILYYVLIKSMVRRSILWNFLTKV